MFSFSFQILLEKEVAELEKIDVAERITEIERIDS
jgi:hypothetical protein